MRDPLNTKPTFGESLLFWIQRFIRSKLTSLTNHRVTDKEQLSFILEELKSETFTIKALDAIAKEARSIGLAGIKTYFKPLEMLYNFLIHLKRKVPLTRLEQIDEELISDFLASQTSGLSDATKKNYRIAMINFFAYVDKQNESNGQSYQFHIELKNWGGLRGKSGQKLPAFMREDEIKRFIDAIKTYSFKPHLQARNRLILLLILYTGIRVSEALGLIKKDFMPDGEIYLIRIRGKGNKERVVMVKKIHIEAYLTEWLSIAQCENSLLFCNQKGSDLTQAYVSRIVEKILLSIHIRKEKNGAHMLRHSFATLLYQKHHDLVLVQEALGHADLNTSRIYTHFDKEKLKTAASIMEDLT